MDKNFLKKSNRNLFYSLIFLSPIVLFTTGCAEDLSKPDNPPLITNFQPEQLNLNMNIDDTLNFKINATDEDDEVINYKFLKDNVEVSNSDAIPPTSHDFISLIISFQFLISNYQNLFWIIYFHLCNSLLRLDQASYTD